MEKILDFDVVILGNPTKYSRFSFGTTLTNIDCLLEESLVKTQKNLTEYFKIYGPIFDCEGNSYTFKNVTSFKDMNKDMYHLNFKQYLKIYW